MDVLNGRLDQHAVRHAARRLRFSTFPSSNSAYWSSPVLVRVRILRLRIMVPVTQDKHLIAERRPCILRSRSSLQCLCCFLEPRRRPCQTQIPT